jgi:hypothetical protein
MKRTHKHVMPDDVDDLYVGIRKIRLPLTRLAGKLGVSRTTLHLMFKHELLMRRVYGIAIQSVIDDYYR